MRKSRRKLAVVNRPWSALTKHQKDLRLDTLAAWHERDIFADDLCGSYDKRVADRAQRSTELEMRAMVRAHKIGIDLSTPGIVGRLLKENDWGKFLKATDADTSEGKPSHVKSAAPAKPTIGGTFEDLTKVIEKVSTKRETPEGAIPEPPEQPKPTQGGPKIDERAARAEDMRLIREKLTRNGRLRLDIEAIAAYTLMPSYFAIACGFDPEPWQSDIIDSNDPRLGVLAARQSGKSLAIGYKVLASALCFPATTSLIISPTLKQSSELLLKVSGIIQIAGLKLSSLTQFGIVLADGQPGAHSRIVCVTGGDDQSGNSARGFTADRMLVLEEASFLQDATIMAVLPSIAARPKAQLVAISSAGLVDSWFATIMTSPDHSHWRRMVIPAAASGRFSAAQIEDLRKNLGARFEVEMNCVFGVQGDSLFSQEQLDAAFGGTDEAPMPPELDPDAAFAHIDIESLFTSEPFPSQRVVQ